MRRAVRRTSDEGRAAIGVGRGVNHARDQPAQRWCRGRDGMERVERDGDGRVLVQPIDRDHAADCTDICMVGHGRAAHGRASSDARMRHGSRRCLPRAALATCASFRA